MRLSPAVVSSLFAVALQLIPVIFQSQAQAIECYQCHGSGNPPDYRPVDAGYRNITSGGFQGNHRTHMSASATPATCQKCHSGASGYGPGHRDGQIQIAQNINNSAGGVYRNGTTVFPQRPLPSLGSCSSVNCHFERETDIWGGPPLTVPNGCSKCHGSPPNGGSSGAAGSHAIHDSYYPGTGGCASCHADHRNDTSAFSHATSVGRNLILAIQNPFTSLGGSYSGPLDDYLPSQTNQFGSCSKVYCHSKGDSRSVFVPNTVPTWGTPMPADCSGCHGNGHGAAAEITSGSHTMHVGRDYYGQHVYACSTCHSTTASDNRNIGNRENHVNRKIDVVPDSTVGGSYSGNGQQPGSAYGQCANNYCHSDVQPDGGVGGPTTYATPTWGAANSVGCGGCHATGGHGHGTTSRMATGSHQKHLTYSFTTTSDTVKCIICHKYTDYPFVTSCFGNPYGNIICHAAGTSAKHANGKIDVRIDPVFGNMSAYNGSPEPGNGYSNCTNTYCHGNGTSVATGVITSNTTVNWGSSTLACSACHGNPPGYANGQPKANSHAKHSAFSCSRCHYGTTTTGTTITSSVVHVNKAFDVSGPPETPFIYTYAATGGTCSSNSCHSDGTSIATGTIISRQAIWGGTTTCSTCHTTPPDYVNGSPKANSHAVHISFNCNRCHYGTTSDGSTITTPSLHGNNTYDVSGSPASPVAYVFAASGGTCSSSSCHEDGTSVSTGVTVTKSATWGTSPGCGACHGNPPSYSNNSPKANSHPKHNRYGYSCEKCHRATTTTGTSITDKTLHANHVYNVTPGLSVQFRFSSSNRGGTCFNATCHNDGTGIATGTRVYVKATWGKQLDCTGCHGLATTGRPSYVNGSPKANSHFYSAHKLNCSICHYSTTTDGANITLVSSHLNGTYDISPKFPTTMQYAYSATGGTCINTSCHATPEGSRRWGAEPDDCNGCHESPPKTPSHMRHFSGTALQASYTSVSIAGSTSGGYLFNCANCHPRDINFHRDGYVQVELYDPDAPAGSIKSLNPPEADYVSGSPIISDSRNYPYTNGTCSNVYCHSYNRFVTPTDCTFTNASGSRICDSYVQANLQVTRVYKDVTWNSTLPGDCSGCHANAPRTDYLSNDGMTGDSHAWGNPWNYEQGHFNKEWFDMNPITCNVCHNDTIKAESKWWRSNSPYYTNFSSVAIADYSRHVNGKTDVAFDKSKPFTMKRAGWWGNVISTDFSLTNAAYNQETKSCVSVSCHMGQTSVKWGKTYRGYKAWNGIDYVCWECHSNGYY